MPRRKQNVKERQSPRLPYHYGWNIVGICVMSLLFANGIALNCFSLFVPVWSKAMNAPPSRIVLAVTLSTSLAVFINPAVGWAADRFPIRRLMTFGLIITALGYVCVAGAFSAGALLVIYPTLIGIGVASATLVPAQAVVSRWFVRRRGFAMGITAAGLVIAGIIFPPLVVRGLPVLGWRTIWLLGAAMIGCIVVPLVLFGLFDHPPKDDRFAYQPSASAQPAGASLREILLRPNFWLLTLISIAILCTYFNITVNSSSLVISHGFNMVTAGWVLSLVNASAFCGKLLFGALADRLGIRGALLLLSLTAALGSAALCTLDSRWSLFLVVPAGLCGGIWAVLPAALAAEFGPASIGRAFGLITGIVPFAIIAAPWVAHVKERTGSYDHALLGLAVFALLGAAVCLLLRRPKSSGRDGGEAAQMKRLDSTKFRAI